MTEIIKKKKTFLKENNNNLQFGLCEEGILIVKNPMTYEDVLPKWAAKSGSFQPLAKFKSNLAHTDI